MMNRSLRCEQENFSSCMIDTKTVPNKRFRLFVHYIEGKFVGAQGHTPCTAANMPIQRWYYVRCHRIIFAHVRAYAIRPYTCSVEIRASLGENTITNRPIQSSCYHRIYRKYVGAYRIRPSRRRTCPFNDGIMFAAIISFSPSRRRTRSLNDDVLFAAIVFIFAHLEGVCPCAPTIFL